MPVRPVYPIRPAPSIRAATATGRAAPRRAWRRVAMPLACAALASLAGCVHLPPDRAALPQRDAAMAGLAADIRLAREGWPAAQWWTEYGDSQLNALVAQALASGPSLATAAARVGAARAALDFNVADRLPRASLDSAANRQRYSTNGLFPAPIGGAYYSEETVAARVGYDLDWWGKRKGQIQAALGEANARRAELAQAEQTLAADIARHYFRLQGDWARLANLRAIGALQATLLDEQRRRIAQGLASVDARHSAESQLSAARGQIALLAAQARREREALRALLGADAGALTDLQPRALGAAAHALPAQLGLELLARRPDLQAARWRVEAALGRIDVARAAYYPDVNLSAAVGLDAIQLSQLLSAPSRTLLLGGTFSLPLFDGKRLGAQLSEARFERDESVADYNQKVLDAVREVAQAGVDLQGVEQQLLRQTATLRASRALLANARARLRHGLADRAEALNAEIATLVQQDGALQLQNQQLGAEVALKQALGGGYDSAPRVAAAAPSPSANNDTDALP